MCVDIAKHSARSHYFCMQFSKKKNPRSKVFTLTLFIIIKVSASKYVIENKLVFIKLTEKFDYNYMQTDVITSYFGFIFKDNLRRFIHGFKK